MELNKIYNQDCLEGMKLIPDGSIDMILCDLPYGTTACKWDVIIPFDKLWAEYERIIKGNGAIVLTASQPFTSALVMSNPKMFRYEFVWQKTKPTGFQNARKMPLKIHENVLVFYKSLPLFRQQNLRKLETPIKTGRKNKGSNLHEGMIMNQDYLLIETGFQNSLIKFSNPSGKGHLHPTQKPVALFEYLIKTYTNEGDTVLDNCMGSGTTAIACMNTNRNFIGFEKDTNYYLVAEKRIQENQTLFTTFQKTALNA